MIVELHGLEVFGHHGVLENEQRDGQVFWFDVRLDVGDRGVSDRIDDAVDYRLVADVVRDVSARRFDLLEALATATAAELVSRVRAEARLGPGAQASRRHAGGVLRRDGRAPMTLAYVGLGANLGDRETAIRRAAELIGARRLSAIVETEPWGYEDQPLFLNAVAEIDTPLTARRLLVQLLDVERRLGRERVGPKWGPRAIDLDLLLFGDAVIDEPGLQVPHPRLAERLFVLEPLAELAPSLEIPAFGTVQALLAGLQSDA